MPNSPYTSGNATSSTTSLTSPLLIPGAWTTPTTITTPPPIRVASTKPGLPEYLQLSPLAKHLLSTTTTTTTAAAAASTKTTTRSRCLPLFALLSHSQSAPPTTDTPHATTSISSERIVSITGTPTTNTTDHPLPTTMSRSDPLLSNPERKRLFATSSATSSVTRCPPYVLPTSWNPKDKGSILDLSGNNMRVSYQGTGKSDTDAASVRANSHIPSQTGIYYYEITITSKGRDGYIGIGFCTATFSLSRLPGWDDLSWGYHGDDGNIFSGAGSGKTYGPTYTTGDVVGCCINFVDMTASFTKNGIMLGVAFRNILRNKKNGFRLYPAVGLRTPGEVIEVNFGARPFKFDITQYCKEERSRFKAYIHDIPLSYIPQSHGAVGTAATPTPRQLPRVYPESKIVHDVVLAYLIHHGYSQTATSFHQSAFGGPASDVEHTTVNNVAGSSSFDQMTDQFQGAKSIHIRQNVQRLIVKGDLHQAVLNITQYYTSLLEMNETARFQLDCLKFIAMTVALSNGGDSNADNEEDALNVNDETSTTLHLDEMDVDVVGSGVGPASEVPVSDISVIHFGQEMQQNYGESKSEPIRQALQELFSLICYPDSQNSPMAYMLDLSARHAVANSLNDAMLEMESLPPTSALERLVRQALCTHDVLVKEDVGAASFIDPERDCLS
ncbi:hypothetical protein BSLG_010258 [Batrachochytrium salamandrivorans]|nr:hypothetical protein BSLG_010258 [Batrachochytrium salamandrivorans]